MGDGLGWIGEHWYSGAVVKDGMLADISLTAVRGVDPVDFVVRLGADRLRLNGLRCSRTSSGEAWRWATVWRCSAEAASGHTFWRRSGLPGTFFSLTGWARTP